MSNQAYYADQPQLQPLQQNYAPPAPNFAQHPSYGGQDANAQYYANGQPQVYGVGQPGYDPQSGYQGGLEQGYNGQPPVNGVDFSKQAQPTIQPMMIPSYEQQRRDDPRNDRGGAAQAAGCCGLGFLACCCCESCACAECLDACL